MPTPPLSDEQCKAAFEAVTKAVESGYSLSGLPSAYVAAAKMLNLRGGSLVKLRLKHGVERGLFDWPAQPAETIIAPEDLAGRQDKYDAEFWRGRARVLEKALAKAEKHAEQLAGVRGQRITIPKWLVPKRAPSKGRAVLGLLLSDLHVGEVVDEDEVLGINGYDVETFRRRIRRLFSATVEIGPRWASDCKLQGVFLVLGGDLISGDIHEELRITNELTAHEQVRVAVEEIAAGIGHLADAFGKVHVVSVPGNHGRSTVKPTAKLYSRLSYDTQAAAMIQDRFEPDGRVTFQISAGADAVTPILGWTILSTHGDKMGTGGGQGFAGPILPIVRGANKVSLQQQRANRQVDLILHGHYHTSANPGPVLSNGSVVGYSEYGNGLRAAMEPPQQWLFLIHEKWGLRERTEIKLEEPTPPPLAQVRVPAGMG